MKRIVIYLYIFLLCLCETATAESLSPSAAVVIISPGAYEARAGVDFGMRAQPESTYRVVEIARDAKLTVLEYGPIGAAFVTKATRAIAKQAGSGAFVPWTRPSTPCPAMWPLSGPVRMQRETWIEGGDFSGLTVQPGSLVCVSAIEPDYLLPVWRGMGSFPVTDGDMIPFVPWDSAQPGDLIGGFTTLYNETTGGKLAANRADNIRLGCARIHGLEIAPGDSFSFNAYCAPYTKHNGYLMVPNISNDGKGYGGGVCQVSTTLYNAVLGLPLQVNRWDPHRRQGVNNVPIALDAAVGSYADLVFTNSLPYPIKLWADAQNGAVTVLVYRARDRAETPWSCPPPMKGLHEAALTFYLSLSFISKASVIYFS